jgi:hypothetical protein
LQLKDSEWVPKSQVLLAALATVWGIDPADVTFHQNKEPALEVEPEDT